MSKPHIGREIRSISNALRRHVEADSRKRKIDKLSFSNAWVIDYLSRNRDKDVYQKDIEKEFGITRSTASRILILMEKKGMIIRSGVAHDSRLKRISLTEKAVSISKEMETASADTEEIMTAGFSDQELEIFCQYLRRLKENLLSVKY